MKMNKLYFKLIIIGCVLIPMGYYTVLKIYRSNQKENVESLQKTEQTEETKTVVLANQKENDELLQKTEQTEETETVALANQRNLDIEKFTEIIEYLMEDLELEALEALEYPYEEDNVIILENAPITNVEAVIVEQTNENMAREKSFEKGETARLLSSKEKASNVHQKISKENTIMAEDMIVNKKTRNNNNHYY